ncbi:MAG: helix-turn-helix domain-containing protein [Desulfobacteraceae bacterium]|nr:helix-turn-helix domain-containing protein [Desulfobacteraceae bacterium]
MERMEWYLPVSQAAEILGCHRREVYRLARMGQLSFVKLPDSEIKISEQSILHFHGSAINASQAAGAAAW